MDFENNKALALRVLIPRGVPSASLPRAADLSSKDATGNRGSPLVSKVFSTEKASFCCCELPTKQQR